MQYGRFDNTFHIWYLRWWFINSINSYFYRWLFILIWLPLHCLLVFLHY